MKKLFILLLAMASFVWAEIKIEMPVRIEFIPNELFDFDKMKDCSKYGYRFDGVVHPSVLDSNVLYGWVDDDVDVEFYVLSGATHSWREVFEDVFSHYQKCGGIVADDSTYKDIFTTIDSVLVPEIEKYLQSNGKYSKALILDYSQGIMLDWNVGGPFDFELWKNALDSVNARNAAISSIAPIKYKLETIRVQNHQLIVSPKLIGRKFVLFDVNGHELRRGTLQNNMSLPAYPTVIKIQGFGTRLLK
jgi:hypothetical protein